MEDLREMIEQLKAAENSDVELYDASDLCTTNVYIPGHILSTSDISESVQVFFVAQCKCDHYNFETLYFRLRRKW